MGKGFPQGFSSIANLADELELCVGWDHLRSIASAANWPDWLSTLEPAKRSLAARLLDLSIQV
jgi:hypothetical protein